MMWSDKAFTIYMGDAGTDAQFDAPAYAADSFDVRVNRMDVRATDPCSDGDTRSGRWASRSGTSLTDTQLHGAVRG
jgi:hypothetical protein